MSAPSPSRRHIATTVVQIVLFAFAIALIGAQIGAKLSFQLRIVLAFLVMGIALAAGWFGAVWARQARPEIQYSEELDSLRKQMMRRGRLGFAALFGIGGGVVGAFTDRFASAPRWSVVLVGLAIGGLAGLVAGHLGAAQTWMSRIPKMRSAGAPNTSLEQTRER